jgi:hypothetical protein
MKSIVLENKTLQIAISPENGAIVGLKSLLTGWDIFNRPALGLSFRMLLPLSEELRNNSILGENQPIDRIRVSKAHNVVDVTWDGLVSERGGVHDVHVQARIEVKEKSIEFSLDVENRSPFVVENVYFPYLGDVMSPPGGVALKTFHYHYATALETGIRPQFRNLRGYFGSDYPVQFPEATMDAGSPMVPYTLLRNDNEGLFLGLAEDTTELVAWGAELRPGFGSSIDSLVPEQNVISGHNVGIRLAAVHIPFIESGTRRMLPRVAMESYVGGWQVGVDIHKISLGSQRNRPTSPAWVHEPHSWLQLHINSPEDELRIRFSDLPKVAQECKRHGVSAIQLVGWNKGGQDQGNPSHDPDPRLGSFDDLKLAIKEIRELGVKLVLFAKFTWSDRATSAFREGLHNLAIKDPYGDYYMHPGYQYQTATQFLDINTKRLIPMCFLSEQYLEVCENEFKKILDLGADGFLFDECLHHTPALLCFAENHGHRRGAPVYANDNLLIERFSHIAKDKNPDFLFAGEACYDREMAVYHLSYHRSESKTHLPLSRYTNPFGEYMTAVTGFNDRNMIGQCLLYRYIISYEPYNFKGKLEDFPLTLSYGKKMDALRTELREYFWDGEFRNEVGGTVTNNGNPHHPYALYKNRQSGRYGLVVANYEDAEIRVSVLVEGEENLRYRTIEDHNWANFDGTISISPRSCVVVLGGK